MGGGSRQSLKKFHCEMLELHVPKTTFTDIIFLLGQRDFYSSPSDGFPLQMPTTPDLFLPYLGLCKVLSFDLGVDFYGEDQAGGGEVSIPSSIHTRT